MNKKEHFAVKTNSGSVYYVEHIDNSYWAVYVNGMQWAIVALVDPSELENCYKSDMAIKSAIVNNKCITNKKINLQSFVNKSILYIALGSGIPEPTAIILQKCGRTTPIKEIIFFK